MESWEAVGARGRGGWEQHLSCYTGDRGMSVDSPLGAARGPEAARVCTSLNILHRHPAHLCAHTPLISHQLCWADHSVLGPSFNIQWVWPAWALIQEAFLRMAGPSNAAAGGPLRQLSAATGLSESKPLYRHQNASPSSHPP